MLNEQLDDLNTLLSHLQAADAVDVALALVSLRPTRHLAELASGTRVHTWCALDTLLVARLLGEDVEVTSRPSHDANPVTFAVHAGQLVADPNIVVSFPAVRDGAGRPFTEAFCPYANAFPHAAAYDSWAATQSRTTTLLTISEADLLARQFAATRTSDAAACCSAA